MIKRSIALSVGLLVSVPAIASADVLPDPCDALEKGDACETVRGEAGVCVDNPDTLSLECVVPTGDGGGGAGGTGGQPATGGAPEGGSPSEGGTGGSGGSGGGTGSTADDGCQAAVGPSNKMLTASALVGVAGLALAALRRRERRSQRNLNR